MASQSRPEPMNASPHHSKVNVILTLSDPIYVAGGHISGKMQVESRADMDSLLGIGVIMVELYAIQEVNSGELSATSTFIHSRRLFQGPGLPPSNAVYSDHVPATSEVSLPAHHYAARHGQTTFFFQLPIPASSPSSINFGPACIRYEMRASVSVAWRGDKHLVTDKRDVKVVESWDVTRMLSPQAVVVTEGGRMWAQATLTNGFVVAGESACVNLQLKNHTQRWTSGVTVTLMRDLYLSQSFLGEKSPPNVSDIATQVEFRGPEYSVPPGIEGIASLVIDIPRHSLGVKGGLRIDGNGQSTEGFFEVRCALKLRIDMPPGSEDTVIVLPVIIYHSLAVPETPPSPQNPISSPHSYAASVSPGLLSPPPEAAIMPIHTGNRIQPYGSVWMPNPVRPASSYLPNGRFEQGIHNSQDLSYPYSPPVQRSISAGPFPQLPYYTPELSSSYTSSPRLLPPPPSTPYVNYVHSGAQVETIDDYTSPDHSTGALALTVQINHHSLPPNPHGFPSQSSTYVQPLPPTRAYPPPISIPLLPNPHDSQGILHSPRPLPSPRHSFFGSVPKNDNVTELERIADEVGRQTDNASLDPPKGDAGVRAAESKGPNLQPDPDVEKTLPAPPVPSGKDNHLLAKRPRVDRFFTKEGPMTDRASFPPQTDQLPHAPPTPPIAAITPIKFPKAPTDLSGLGANSGKESGLDALERKLLAEVGTRKFDAEERPHVRSVVQPIAIPPSGPPPDTVNDSAISSLTLADREGFLNSRPEREQEQDRDSDERTQHMGGGGHSPSDDDRDVRTQKGKGSRKLGKSKSRHSEEDLEKVGRRRERKKAKDEEGRKLRKEAKGRVAAWLGEIDASAPPLMDDPSVVSPTTSHFVPVEESASFSPTSLEMMDKRAKDDRRGNDMSTDKDVSASPNPRSSGFVTISSLNTVGGTNGSVGEGSPFKPSPRRSSFNDLPKTPLSSPNRPAMTRQPMSRSPSAEVKAPQPLGAPQRKQSSPPQPPPAQSNRLFAGRLLKSADPEVKYDVRSARGGRGGKVTQVASLWAAKASTDDDPNPNDKTGNTPPAPVAGAPKKLKPPSAVKKPGPNVLKRSPISTRPLTTTGSPGIATGFAGSTPVAIANRVGGGAGEARTPGTRETTKATKATTVPAVVSSSHAVPMLSSTASLARVKAHGPGQSLGYPARSLPPMISESVTMSDVRNASKGGVSGGGIGKVGVAGGSGPGRALGDLAFGQARLRDLIKKYQG